MLLSGGLALYACQGPDSEDDIDTDLVILGEVQSCADPAPGLDRFTESSADRGLDFVLPRATDASGVFIEGRGGNVAMHDLDLDGDLDLVFLVWGFAPGWVS